MRSRSLIAVIVAAMAGVGHGDSAMAGPTAAPTGPGAPAVTGPGTPPANLLTGKSVTGAALDPMFAMFKVDRFRAAFAEDKHTALLARPLKTAGSLFFDRARGIVRLTTGAKPQHVVLTTTTLTISRKGKPTEVIPLDKSKDLKAFALVFPTLLRGDRPAIERSFDVALHGSDKDWWALAFTPKLDSLKKLVRNVVVIGRKGDVVLLQVNEASGDRTETRFSEIRKNGDVPDAELATAFDATGGPAASTNRPGGAGGNVPRGMAAPGAR